MHFFHRPNVPFVLKPPSTFALTVRRGASGSASCMPSFMVGIDFGDRNTLKESKPGVFKDTRSHNPLTLHIRRHNVGDNYDLPVTKRKPSQ